MMPVNDRWTNLAPIKTPIFIVDEVLLERNLQVLDSVQRRTGCKILLALKGFAMWSTFPLVRQYLQGISASGPIEARLGREEFGKEVHTYAPAYSEEDIEEVIRYSDHIIFNSFRQLEKYRPVVPRDKSLGIRVNPGYAEVQVDLYNPCAPCSRLGVTLKNFEGQSLEGLEGLHFHAMCEQGADTLKRILIVFEGKFGKYIPQMKWVNFGGGHHITREDYDVDLLCRLVGNFQEAQPVEFGNAFEPATRGWVTQDRSPIGHIGYPAAASAEKGETLFELFAQDLVQLIDRVIAWDGRSWEG